jgi:hypothetical protein
MVIMLAYAYPITMLGEEIIDNRRKQQMLKG